MRAFAVAVVLLLTPSMAAWAKDRAVTDAERLKLEAAVKAEGCSGGKMEHEGDKFEVDEALCADGKKYDLDFDQNFKLVKKELDND